MKTFTWSSLAVALLALPTFAFGGELDAKQAFEKMKSLVGKWQGTMGDGSESIKASVEYKLTGSGTALVETLGPGSPFEMVSVYHLDGSDLVMTHYCGAGNQPTMKFKPGKSDSSLFFDFVKGSNMKPTDMHMHSLTVSFAGPDHITAMWVSYRDGKPSDKAAFDFHRIKS